MPQTPFRANSSYFRERGPSGDAAGFLDPFTGEGLHRALVSAELAGAAIGARSRGRRAGSSAWRLRTPRSPSRLASRPRGFASRSRPTT